MQSPNRPRNPRIFVGTLYSGEAEFTECTDMISRQSGVDIFHHIVRGLPEYKAHNSLWDAWEAAKHEFDLFAKIDADTVLIDEQALLRVWRLFEANAEVTGAQILLHDYFTDSLIAGLNFLKPEVKLQKSKSRLHADHADYGHRVVLKGAAVEHLAPIGWHARRPSDIQSFRYGFHRMLKGQLDTMRKVHEVWLKRQDYARRLALAGAWAAYNAGGSDLSQAGRLRSLLSQLPFFRKNYNYTDSSLLRDMDRLAADPRIEHKIQELAEHLMPEKE